MSDERWISVCDWPRFQHYDPEKRALAWIKAYLDLLHNDAYLELSEHRALVLHRLWLEYASTRCRLRLDTARLSRRLFLRVTTADLESLNHAGFIEFVASKSLASGYQPASNLASPEKRREVLRTSLPKNAASTGDSLESSPVAAEKKKTPGLLTSALTIALDWNGHDTDVFNERLDGLEREHGERLTTAQRDELWERAFQR